MTDGSDDVWKLAATGDRAALADLRDQRLMVAAGLRESADLPTDEALVETEVLARLAASSGDSIDTLTLLTVYQLRVNRWEADRAAAQGLAEEAVAANDIDAMSRWSQLSGDLLLRSQSYQVKIDRLATSILDAPNCEAIAILARALSINADNGNEQAALVLQGMFDSISPTKTAAIMAEVRTQERQEA